MATGKFISQDEALASLKTSLHALVNTGISPDRLIGYINALLEEIYTSTDISLVSPTLPSKITDHHITVYGELSFDRYRRVAEWKGGKIYLSPMMARLLEVLIDNAGNVISHQEIIQYVYGDEEKENPANVCRILVSRLRSQLGSLSKDVEWIETVRGRGYVLTGS